MLLLKHKNIDFSNIFHYLGTVVLLFGAFFLAAMKEDQSFLPSPPAKIEQEKSDSVSMITLGFVGDLMCHGPQMKCALQPDGRYDFNPAFDQVRERLSKPDIMIGNLELTTAGTRKPYASYPAFNTPDAYIDAVKNAGFDFLVTANNHSMDTGEEGLLRTLDNVRKSGMGSTGTFSSQKDRDSIRILNSNGISIALLNYTYGTNGAYPVAGHRYMLNVADSGSVRKDVQRARELKPDLVVVIYHWGNENIADPTAKQDSMFHWAADHGADIVIGAHPHVIGPVQYYKTSAGASLDSGIVAWSLGNFISNQYWRYTDAGMILELKISKNHTTGRLSLEPPVCTPTWVYRGYDKSQNQYMVVPAAWCGKDSLPGWMNEESKTRMCEAFSDTRQMMARRTGKVIIGE